MFVFVINIVTILVYKVYEMLCYNIVSSIIFTCTSFPLFHYHVIREIKCCLFVFHSWQCTDILDKGVLMHY